MIINFADPISYSDYAIEKDAIWNRNKGRYSQMSYAEIRAFKDYKQFHLIRIDGKQSSSCFLSYKTYWVFYALCIGQLYSTFVNMMLVNQIFTVRKIVSTRFNLMESTEGEQYNSITPAMNVYNKMYTFKKKKTIIVNEGNQVGLPTKEEIDKANQIYSNNIPKYTSTEKGIVNELTGFSDNYNLPPSAANDKDNTVTTKPTEIEMNSSGISSEEMMNNNIQLTNKT